MGCGVVKSLITRVLSGLDRRAVDRDGHVCLRGGCKDRAAERSGRCRRSGRAGSSSDTEGAGEHHAAERAPASPDSPHESRLTRLSCTRSDRSADPALGGPARCSHPYGDEREVVRMHDRSGPHGETDRRANAVFDEALGTPDLLAMIGSQPPGTTASIGRPRSGRPGITDLKSMCPTDRPFRTGRGTDSSANCVGRLPLRGHQCGAPLQTPLARAERSGQRRTAPTSFASTLPPRA